MSLPVSHQPLQRRSARMGLSVVELLVGVTISLFILAGAASMATSQLGDQRRLLLDAQLQQDVRLTMDLVTRDLRRAAYWGKAYNAIWTDSWATSLVNPYTSLSPEAAADAASVTFQRSTDELSTGVMDNNQLDNAEYGGFQLDTETHTIKVLLGRDNWQTLTDPEVIKVTAFKVTMVTATNKVPCGAICSPDGEVLGPGGCPLVQLVRNATVEIQAEAANDSSIRRSLRSDLHLRNDVVREKCPS